MDLVAIAKAATSSTFIEQPGSGSYTIRSDGTGERTRIFRGEKDQVSSFLALYPAGSVDSTFPNLILRQRSIAYDNVSAIVTLSYQGYTDVSTVEQIPTTYDRTLVPATCQHVASHGTFTISYIQPQFSVTFPTNTAPIGPGRQGQSGIAGYPDSNIQFISAFNNQTGASGGLSFSDWIDLRSSIQIKAVGFQAYNNGDIWIVTETWAKVAGNQE